MIRHIVMWSLKDEAQGNSKEQNAILIKDKLESLKGQVAELIEIEVGIDIKIDGNDDVVLVALVKDREALNGYQNHPLHQAILPFVRECCKSRHAVDYTC